MSGVQSERPEEGGPEGGGQAGDRCDQEAPGQEGSVRVPVGDVRAEVFAVSAQDEVLDS